VREETDASSDGQLALRQFPPAFQAFIPGNTKNLGASPRLHNSTPPSWRRLPWWEERDMNNETVGTLLAAIANSINDGLRIMMYADKRAWGPDEFEQLRLLEETLDNAKKDFQSLPALVHGRGYYEHDRKGR
jgi:hypothetical protein